MSSLRLSKQRPRSSRPSLSSRLNTATSTPNLRLAYNRGVSRKSSLNYLGSEALSTILDDHDIKNLNSMAPFTPSRGDGLELEIGELVDVPGNMHGTVRFIGSVQGKMGKFAGVELSEEFAAKGKNSGDVDGVHYFSTFMPGAGIFLPISRAIRRGSPLTPSTPSLSSYKLSSHKLGAYTPPTPSVPKFSQSVGPRAPSPQTKRNRPSIARPESPLRKPQIMMRPSLGSLSTPAKGPQRYNSPVPAKFGQSVRGTQDSRDPSKKPGFTPRHSVKGSIGSRSASALGGASVSFSDDDTTPIGVARTTTEGSMGAVPPFNAKIRPASRARNDEEVDRLRGQLEQRDKQLREQASTLAEMENSLAEVQTLMSNSESGNQHHDKLSDDDKNAAHLRTVLRGKNEKIAMLTAEFDAHRADFRSTIDTLELASTETERVYEKRVDDLLQEVRELQDRGEDVDSVAQQLKQLEELVQELEDGLEDARRGEAEARGEVEFLRGEVERTRSELRREREKAAATMTNGGFGTNGEIGSMTEKGDSRNDEIRGLKAIIHSLSRDAISDIGSPKSDSQGTPTQRHDNVRPSSDMLPPFEDRVTQEKLEREVQELKNVVESKIGREEDLEREIERLRSGSAGPQPNQRASSLSTVTLTQDRSSRGTIVSWRDKELQRSPESSRHRNTLETMPESDNYSSANESFCEICETSGHDILTCTNMFPKNGAPPTGDLPPILKRSGQDVVEKGLRGLSPNIVHEGYKYAPLSPIKNSSLSPLNNIRTLPNPMESGPVAGKESGVMNLDKWCGVCEREGHDSIDCPFEDAF